MPRKWLIALAVILGLGAVALYFLRGSLDELVTSAIQERGSLMLGTPVTVGAVEISASRGTGTLRDLTVANPPGYSSTTAIRVAGIDVQVAPTTMSQRPVPVDRVTIEGLELTWELGEEATNIGVLRENLRAYNERRAAERGEPRAEGERVPRAVIGLLEVRGATLRILAPEWRTEPIELPIGDIVLRDVGAGGGMTPGQLTAALLQALRPSLTNALTRIDPRELLERTGGNVREATREFWARLRRWMAEE